MKKIVITSLVLCAALQAVIIPTQVGQTSYNGVTLDVNSAYAIVHVPQDRGVVSYVYVNNSQARCQTSSTIPGFSINVCFVGKRESFDQVANIKIVKNAQVYETGTVVYSKTTSR